MEILLLGATGRLGSQIQNVASHKNIKIIPLDRKTVQNHEYIAQKLSQSPKVICDVSLPEGTQTLITTLLKINQTLLTQNCKGLVIGTTGHTHEHLQHIQKISEILPTFLIANFSRGIFLFENILNAVTPTGLKVADLARTLGFDLGMWECHHTQKRDSPSGTAKKLAQSINLPHEKISSSRVGFITGEHTLLFSNEAEELRITHTAHHRSLFAYGAIELCTTIFAKNLEPKLYTQPIFF